MQTGGSGAGTGTPAPARSRGDPNPPPGALEQCFSICRRFGAQGRPSRKSRRNRRIRKPVRGWWPPERSASGRNIAALPDSGQRAGCYPKNESPRRAATEAPGDSDWAAARCRAERTGQRGSPHTGLAIGAGEWRVEGNELQIKVAASAAVIEMSFGADAKRLAIATASGVLGRPASSKWFPEARWSRTAAPRDRIERWRPKPCRTGSRWCGACRRNSARKFERSSIIAKSDKRSPTGYRAGCAPSPGAIQLRDCQRGMPGTQSNEYGATKEHYGRIQSAGIDVAGQEAV